MGTFLYFAYGSNMLAERLTARCLSAKSLGAATAQGYALTFTKKSRDGSGKAEMRSTNGDSVVHGVLFEIGDGEAGALDTAEGKGYERTGSLRVARLIDGTSVEARTYLGKSSSLEAGLKPYDWYLALTLAGAMQNGLPEDYIESLRKTAWIADEDTARRAAALECLAAADFESAGTVLCIR